MKCTIAGGTGNFDHLAFFNMHLSPGITGVQVLVVQYCGNWATFVGKSGEYGRHKRQDGAHPKVVVVKMHKWLKIIAASASFFFF